MSKAIKEEKAHEANEANETDEANLADRPRTMEPQPNETRAKKKRVLKSQIVAKKAREKRAKIKERNKTEKKRANWTQEEDRFLSNSWGETSLSSLATSLGRTFDAVRARAFRLGLRAPNRGRWRLNTLAKHLGYSNNTVRKAFKAFNDEGLNRGVGWKRRSKYKHFAIDDADIEKIEALLKQAECAGRFFQKDEQGRVLPEAYKRKTQVRAECVDCHREMTIKALGCCDTCHSKRLLLRRAWGVSGVSSSCVVCGTTAIVPHTKTECADCFRLRNYNRQKAKRKAEREAKKLQTQPAQPTQQKTKPHAQTEKAPKE